MSNVDEQKVKDLLHCLVQDMFAMVESNMYRENLAAEMHARIDRTDLLTDQAPCATVKKAGAIKTEKRILGG